MNSTCVREQPFWKNILEMINPSWSTSEFESAVIRGRGRHRIAEMEFVKTGYPCRVTGIVYPTSKRNTAIKVHWNRLGKCRSPLGARLNDFDLIRQPGKEIRTAESINESIALGLIVIIICTIF
jgi:hypothetical protein